MLPPTDPAAAKVDHTPHTHPASPAAALPDSFATYRVKAQSHGPLGGSTRPQPAPAGVVHASVAGTSQVAHGVVGGHSGRALGAVQPAPGTCMDRNDLPARFRRLPWAEGEADAVESGGATML